jgi:mono/diheme cytochrome c family protein
MRNGLFLFMRNFRGIAITALATGLLVFQVPQVSIYAAGGGLSGGQAQAAAGGGDAGAASYAQHCAACHGEHREGNAPVIPSLIGVKQKLSDEQIMTILHNGKGQMPAFANLPSEEIAALVRFLGTPDMPAGAAPKTADTTAPASPPAAHTSDLSKAGGALFQQNCAFCHGRDAMGGETGPDLTKSKLVLADVNGDKISDIVLNGRPDKGMPAFKFSSDQLAGITAFLHSQVASAKKGGRRGVEVADLQTGNVEAGKAYFNGAGGCAKCHSPTGDLAGIAKRYEGLALEERMLYPRNAKSTVTVTLPSGEKMNGILAYQDEFTIGLLDANGTYHSWPVTAVKFVVDSPVEAHVDLFPKYTDDDIHNLMAYLQTLR